MGEGLIVPLASPEAADPDRFGPKAANLARLGHAGLPIPAGFCVDAAAYRVQIAALGLEDAARNVGSEEPGAARRAALAMKLGLMDQPIAPQVLGPLLEARRALVEESGALMVVRSSALVEDRFGSSFAGQFESYLGLESEEEFVTAVRSCWAALWSTRVLRYMATHDASPADTAMAILVQPLVSARVAGGGLSRTTEQRHSRVGGNPSLGGDDADGEMVINATWGLGSSIAQGEVVPERIVLTREGVVRGNAAGRRFHRFSCAHSARTAPHTLFSEPCLDTEQAIELGRLLRRTEDVMGMPVEIEWAQDDAGFKLLQARSLHLEPAHVPDEIWLRHPALGGQPSGVGWGSGRACVVSCECELSRIAPGDILVTKVAGPALGQVLSRVAGVVAELGGSTSHLASLARERGIPMVLGVLDATLRIPEGAQVAVDGVAGVVRWMR
ncbi:MAG: PEP/pyruvate-binding domain-containing protein [Usitatibacter sp.]